MWCVEGESEAVDSEAKDEEGRYSYRVMLQRDKRRWERADVDKDGELSKEEFTSFLHPEEMDHMRDLIIDVWLNSFPSFITTYGVLLVFFL